MPIREIPFTRPLVPFNCDKGCGPGTTQVPKESCAIDLNRDITNKYYDWRWVEK